MTVSSAAVLLVLACLPCSWLADWPTGQPAGQPAGWLTSQPDRSSDVSASLLVGRCRCRADNKLAFSTCCNVQPAQLEGHGSS